MKRMTLWVCALTALLISQSLHAAETTDKTWQAYPQSMLKLPGLLRYYTFDANDGNGMFIVDKVANGEASIYGIMHRTDLIRHEQITWLRSTIKNIELIAST